MEINERVIYGLVLGIESQKTIISTHCFGDCGQIILGVMDGGEFGPLLVCHTPASQCPYMDREMSEPIGDLHGTPIFLRMLKSQRGNSIK